MLMKQACASVLGTIIGLICVRQAIGENLCRPDLTINEVEFSTMMPPTLERERSRGGRCLGMHGEFQRIFRNGLHEAERECTRSRVPQTVPLVGAFVCLASVAFGGRRLGVCRR